jgi:hypothetical protein
MIYIFYSCFNNYDLLIGENLNFLKKHSKKIILVDDHSTIEEQTKGKSIAKKLGLRFEINPGKGLQAGVDFIVKNICNKDDWILTIQQDVHFKCNNAVNEIEDIVRQINFKKYNVGAFGFPNYVTNAHYHKNHVNINEVTWEMCWLGVFNLSSSSTYKTNTILNFIYRSISRLPFIKYIERRFWQKVIFHRNFAPLTYPKFNETVKNYEGLVAIDLPVWTAIVISANAWKKVIQPDPNFIFHLWFPDIAMQFMNQNWAVCLNTKQIVVNNWRLKSKYGIQGSVQEGKGESLKMEKYGEHFKKWFAKWRFDYEDPFPSFKYNFSINDKSLLYKMITRSSVKPYKKFKIEEK